jgi:AraC-like DNA-binding protein
MTKYAMVVCGCNKKQRKRKKKMKRQHTEEFILKIAAELNKTPYEVKSQVNEYLGENLLYYQAINYLRDLKADDIRFILRFNKW